MIVLRNQPGTQATECLGLGEVTLERLGKKVWGKDGMSRDQNAIGNEEVERAAELGNARW